MALYNSPASQATRYDRPSSWATAEVLTEMHALKLQEATAYGSEVVTISSIEISYNSADRWAIHAVSALLFGSAAPLKSICVFHGKLVVQRKTAI